MTDLYGKRVLFVAPKYFGYEKYIEKALEQRGAEVITIVENLDMVSMWYRLIYVYLPSFKEKLQYRYYYKKISSMDGQFDYVLVIRGSSLTSETMRYIKKCINPKCTYLMYQWDGIQNNQDVLKIVDYFDKISTFDVDDAEQMGWYYTPLFYINMLTKQRDGEKDIDILYIGSVHSSRIKILKLIKSLAQNKKLNLYAHLFTPRLLYYKRKYLSQNTDYIDADPKDLKFESLSIKEVYELYGRSKIVIDFTHPHQTGFTMRTIECVGNKCKLITNNQYIKNADFYNPKNIMVYGGTSIDITEEFIKTEYEENSTELQDRYSLDGWIDSIFGENNV